MAQLAEDVAVVVPHVPVTHQGVGVDQLDLDATAEQPAQVFGKVLRRGRGAHAFFGGGLRHGGGVGGRVVPAGEAAFLQDADDAAAHAVFAQPAQRAEHVAEPVGEVVGLHHVEADDARIVAGHLEAGVGTGAQAGDQETVGGVLRAGQQGHGVFDGGAGLLVVREAAAGEAAVAQARQVEADGRDSLGGGGARQFDVEPVRADARQHAGIEQDESGRTALRCAARRGGMGAGAAGLVQVWVRWRQLGAAGQGRRQGAVGMVAGQGERGDQARLGAEAEGFFTVGEDGGVHVHGSCCDGDG